MQSISRELDAKLLIWREPYALGLLGALNHLAVSEDEWTSANGLVEKLELDTGLSAVDIRIGVMSGILVHLIEWRNPSKSPLGVNDVQLMGLEVVRLSQIGAQYLIDNLGD